MPIETPISSSQCSWYCADGDGCVDDLLEDVLRRISGRDEGVHLRCSSFGVRCASRTNSGDRAPRLHRGSTDHRYNRRTCCLPSGLSPSVQDFHLVNRPLAAVGSRTVTAGSEFHRPRSTCTAVCRTSPPNVPRVFLCVPSRLVDSGPGVPACGNPVDPGRAAVLHCARASPHPRDVPRPRALVAVALARAHVRPAPPPAARARAHGARPSGTRASPSRCGSPTTSRTATRPCGPSPDWSDLGGGAAGPPTWSSPTRGSCRWRSTATVSSCADPGSRCRATTRCGRTTSSWRCSTRSSSPTGCRATPAPTGTRMPCARPRSTCTASTPRCVTVGRPGGPR